MIQGLGLNKLFLNNNNSNVKQEIKYTLYTKDGIAGPLRAMHKFVVIMLTTKGSDPLHPWFGTYINDMITSNTNNKEETILSIREEANEAIKQFFKLQALEGTSNYQTDVDVINSIEILNIDIDIHNKVTMTIKFKPLKESSIVFSIDFTK